MNNKALHANSIIIGKNLTSEEEGEIVLGSPENELRFKTDGEIVYNKKIVINSKQAFEAINASLRDVLGTDSKIHDMSACLLSILDALKLYDTDSLNTNDETLSQMMFRKMEGYNIDLNKELGVTHLKPIIK